MPRQENNKDEKSSSFDTRDNESSSSYWDAPPEQKLEGKTLSTMELSMLSKDENSADTTQNERKTSSKVETKDDTGSQSGGYWEWQESIRQSLSKMSLTDLFFQNTEQKQKKVSTTKEPTNFLQTENEADKDQNGNADNSSKSKDDVSAERPKEQSSGSSYWFWRNASLKNLSTASLRSLERTAKASEDKQVTNAPPTASATNANTDSFWFWRNPSMKNMTEGTDSNVSLETLEKTARESDRMQGKDNSGPISNLQHKLRSSWRQSFQKLSSNSLTRLDETKGSGTENNKAWKQIFSSGRSQQDSFPVQEQKEEEEENGGEEGALSF